MTLDLRVGLMVEVDGFGVNPGYREERQVEVADPVERAVQGGLVDDVAGDHGFSGVRVGDGESVEPCRPLDVDLASDADVVNSHLFSFRAGQCRNSAVQLVALSEKRSVGADG